MCIYWSCDATSTCLHKIMPTASLIAPLYYLVKMIKMRCNIIFWSYYAIGLSLNTM